MDDDRQSHAGPPAPHIAKDAGRQRQSGCQSTQQTMYPSAGTAAVMAGDGRLVKMSHQAGLIINADDLAIHPQIDAGILKAYREGVLTSASMLVTTPFLQQAVRVVRDTELPVGIHLSLTMGKALAQPRLIPDL